MVSAVARSWRERDRGCVSVIGAACVSVIGAACVHGLVCGYGEFLVPAVLLVPYAAAVRKVV